MLVVIVFLVTLYIVWRVGSSIFKTVTKTKMTVEEVARVMAEAALLPLENPSKQDQMFQEQALTVGVEKKRFTFEAVALSTYSMAAIINRERLEGKISAEKTELLVMGFLRAINDRLRNTTICDFILLGLGPDETFELMTERGARYSEPTWGRGKIDDIPRFFAEFCGFPDSDILERIGWSLIQVRGNYWGDWLRTVKIIESEGDPA